MKLITVLNRGYVLTSRGKCLGPIYPFLEGRDHIVAMLARGLDVYEVVDGNKGIKLTLDNIDNDNTNSEPDVVFVKSLSLDSKTIDLQTGKTQKLTVLILPEDATNKDVVWTSDKEEVATVVNGLVVAKSEGIANIKVALKDGSISDTCVVNVTNPVVKVQTISLSETEVTLQVNDEHVLIPTVVPSDAVDAELVWTSDKDEVASVVDGTVLAMGEGKATIKAHTVDNRVGAVCYITVEAQPVIEDVVEEVTPEQE